MTREFLISEIQRWASEHDGRPPRYADWNATRCRRKLGHEREPGWPSTMAVQNHFGSWMAGLAAAGFTTAPGAPVHVCPDCGCGARRDERCARCYAFLERWGVPWSAKEAARRRSQSRQALPDVQAAYAKDERVIELRAEGLLNYEIAERLGVSVPAVNRSLRRARRRGLVVPLSPYRHRATRTGA